MGRWSLAGVGISGVIGAGIYTAPASLAAELGPASVAAYVVAAAVVLIFGHSLAVLGRTYESTGGPYTYVGEVFGPFWGFQVGWFFAVARFTALGAVTTVFVAYLARFIPACSEGLGRATAIIVCLAVLSIINIVGIRNTALAMNLFAIGKVLPLVFFVLAGLFSADVSRLGISEAPAFNDFGRAVLLLIFVFGGFEFLTVPSEESTRPAEQVPFALAVSIGVSSALFIAVQAIALAVAADLSKHQDALAHAAQQFSGAAGALAMTLGALVATVGTNLANVLVNSRMLYAFSRDGRMPAWLGALHARFRTPVAAIVLSGAIGAALAISGTFTHLASLSAAARLVTYGGCCASVVRLRSHPGAHHRALLPAAASVIAVGLIFTLPPRDLLLAALAPAAGVLIYAASRRNL